MTHAASDLRVGSAAPAQWREEYLGGSAAAEAIIVRDLASQIMQVQYFLQKSSGAPSVLRGFHAKAHAGITNAELRVSGDLPPEFQVGFLKPGTTYTTTVRFSNASGSVQPDSARDMRGIALRVHVSPGEVHDFLMTNGPASHARNAPQFIAFARAMAGNKLLTIPRLLFGLGLSETIRIFRNIVSVTAHPVRSVATERYWSRSPILCGTSPIKFMLVPAAKADAQFDQDSSDPDYLRAELVRRLASGPVTFELKFQKYVDAIKTPIEDGSVEWREQDAPPCTVAQLVIPRQDLTTAAATNVTQQVDDLEFNPWHTTEEFRPLGNLNRARHVVYAASADHRFGYRFYRPASTRNALFGGLSRAIFGAFNQWIPWHKLPGALASMNLLAIRQTMRLQNIYDTEEHPDLPVLQPQPRPHPITPANPIRFQTAALGPGPFLPAAQPDPGAEIPLKTDPKVLTSRTPDITYNDLSDPHMGSVGARFGRNVPLARAVPNRALLLEPNPRLISQVLLARDTFKPATTLNVLAGAWIQFMIHGWFDHLRNPLGHSDIEIPLAPNDPWDAGPMRINSTRQASPGSTNPPRPPAFTNTETAWWDASQIYGSRQAITNTIRSWTDGKLKMGADGLLLEDPSNPGVDLSGFNNNWWVGLSLLHTIFFKEHNAICDALRREYPTWSDEELFQKARLINAALMGKIHTVEWTPAILANPVLEKSMNIVWYGAPKDWLTRFGIWLMENETMLGVPGSLPNHHAAAYCNTEEFAAVYKMHPLMPDDFDFHDHTNDRFTGHKTLTEIQGRFTRDVLKAFPVEDLLYSFGIAHPGAITLHNYPNSLRHIEHKVEGGVMAVLDVATIDIVRERERGVPRYNDFRELLHMPRIKSWDKLCANPQWARELREVYGDLDKVDTMVGMFAETPPKGFGFSDTTFHIFILTATRRIQSDRFFTVDYTPEVYTPLGIRWIANNGMKTVLMRHYPELGPFLMRVVNAFKPWHRVGPSMNPAPTPGA
jgi:hypothetical protein